MAIIDDVLVAADNLRIAVQDLDKARKQRQDLERERAALVAQIVDADATIQLKQTALQQARVAFKTLVAGL